MTSTKVYHHHHHQQQQPLINPFRIPPPPPRCEDTSTSWMANPIVRSCYVMSVGSLLFAVSMIAYKTYVQFPHPIHNDIVGSSTTSTTSSSTSFLSGPNRLQTMVKQQVPPTDVKILQPDIRIRTGSVSHSDTRITSTISKTDTMNQLPISKIKNDDSKTKDKESYHHHDDDDEVNGTTDIADTIDEEMMLRPGEVHAKMLGETKDQVKLEMKQEDYSDHTFGKIESNDDTNLRRQQDQQQQHTNDVVVLPRKGEILLDRPILIDTNSTMTSSHNDTNTTTTESVVKVIMETPKRNQQLRHRKEMIHSDGIVTST